jgi:hypothetical protein
MANTYEQIGNTITVGAGGAASISFSGIPASYTDLVLKISGRTTEAYNYGGFNLQFNGTSTGLSAKELSGVTTTVYGVTRSIPYYIVNGANATAGIFSNAELYVPNYASSDNKTFSFDGAAEDNANTANVAIISGVWSNTAAITSITLVPQSSNTFVQYSSASLYGIKKD